MEFDSLRRHAAWFCSLLGGGLVLAAVAPQAGLAQGPAVARDTVAVQDRATGGNGAPLSLEALKRVGAKQSRYRQWQPPRDVKVPRADLATFRKTVQPLLTAACVQCHGPDAQEGNIRIDTLDPDLVGGDDVNWWVEVFAVLGKGEMPPADAPPLADADRGKIVQWLSREIQVASTIRRSQQGHSSFRRMTRYEYNYALQDLLGLPLDFAKDLPPESASEDGFHNSSELLHITSLQLATYREAGSRALELATVRGPQPAPWYWGVAMQAAAADTLGQQEQELEKVRRQFRDDSEKLEQEVAKLVTRFQSRPNGTHYKHLPSGRMAGATWRYPGAKYAWKPASELPAVPAERDYVAVIPPRQKLIVELGNSIPDRGTLRVRFRASRAAGAASDAVPSLQLEFGWQASNDSHASVRISQRDIAVDASPDAPEFYQWEVPLSEIYPRNLVRKTGTMGGLPSPSEYIKFVNSSVAQGDVQIDYVEVTAPADRQWPPASHTRIFPGDVGAVAEEDESAYSRGVLADFMTRAWRRTVTEAELAQKLELLAAIRPQCRDLQEALTEVLATVVASPKFLYLVGERGEGSQEQAAARLSATELATRLAMFLWCSIPDKELRELAESGRLSDSQVLGEQVQRMLADPRAQRFARHFVRQWLGMQLLDYLQVDRKAYPQFDPALKEAMQEEPVAFFYDLLLHNRSALDFLHADYTLANERLAAHYGLAGVAGNHFRRVPLLPEHRRGGVLAHAGLLAMNSDGVDSHPLKRGIWMLERLLDDPPPPPPPAVPEIDLADPEIAKLTLKERIANHRNQAACFSCHQKIDPWGIAFENFDAVGKWRTTLGGKPVDAASELFNGHKLEGLDGLKRYLLTHRQDQFVRALVSKLTTFALGRPLTFGDRSRIDQITAEVREQGDGLATMVTRIVASELFRSP